MRLALLLTLLTSVIHAQESKPKIEIKVASDYLALHATGKAPQGATAIEYRLDHQEDWSVGRDGLTTDGAFSFDVTLPTSRWSALHVRAMKGAEVLASTEKHAGQDHFTMLTPERIAQLPEAERAAWTAYLERSKARAAHEYDVLATECRQLKLPQSKPAPDNGAELEIDSDTPESWFARPETVQLADTIVSYQTPTGGWSKAVDYKAGARTPGMHWTSQKGDAWHYCGTIDNRTTTEQIKVLAGVVAATADGEAKAAALRGIEYLLEAQYPNGGWPQNYPVESGYHEAITLNDDAITHVLELLIAITTKKAPFGFADAELVKRAQAALDKGIACLAAMQVKVDGKPTVWCAQHHPITLEPVAARAKEPPSLSGAESANLLKMLMRQGPLTADCQRMIEAGIAWLAVHQITGLRKVKNDKGKTDYVPDPTSKEVYWARFYDVQTAKPMFAGADDGIVYATFSEMAAKNRVSYDFFSTKPRDVIGKEVERWKKRLAKGK